MLQAFSLGYLYHGLLGALVAALVLLVGAGGVRLCVLPRRVEPADFVVLGLPVGMALLGSLALLALAGGAWRLLAAALLLTLIVVAAPWRTDMRAALRPLGFPLLIGLPSIALLALVNGFLLRGPTDKLGWSGYGDIAWYVGRMFNFLHQLNPPYEFLVEGERYPYAPHGPTMLGALLIDLPGFNPFLFVSVATPIFFGIAVIALLSAGAATRRPVGFLGLLAAAVLFAGAFIYPSWLVESLPVAYAVPVVFAAARFVAPWPYSIGSLLLIGVLVGMSTFLTKVFMVSFVIGGVGCALLALGRQRLDAWRFRAMIAAAAAIMIAYVAWMLMTFGWALRDHQFGPIPLVSHIANILGGNEPPVPELGNALRDIALLLLLVAAVRAERSALTLLIVGGIVQYWLSPSFSAISGTASIILVALAVLADERWRRDLVTLLLPAAALLLVASLLRERFAVAVFGSMLGVMGLIWASGASASLAGTTRRLLLAGEAACVVVVFGILGIMAIEAGPLAAAVARQPHVLLPEAVDIWRQVRQRTPADALVFTDQTGEEVSLAAGWNSLAASGGRQLYIAGWYHTRWRQRPAARAERYAVNDAVLAGRTMPSTIALSRGYGSYWAVVGRMRTVPAGFVLVYENAQYRLLRIEHSR